MKETRLNRYKDYRNSCIKDGSVDPNSSYINTYNNTKTTTFTLPIEEVVKKDNENELNNKIYRLESQKKKLIIGLAVAIIAFLIIGIWFFAFVAFGGK